MSTSFFQAGNDFKWVAIGFPVTGLFLLLLISWIYWPGTAGPALLDDRSSVLVIEDLRDQPGRALDFVLGDNAGLLGRPVSMATFVLERMYLGHDLAISKQVNILLHLLNAVLVIWLFWLLFGFYKVPAYPWLAIILGALWALHPFLVSTVLYVVQRMAILATLFMLLSAISYVYWRLALIDGRRGVVCLLLLPVFMLLGLLSKENAVVLVPILVLLELLFFRGLGAQGRTIRWLYRLAWGLIIVGALSLLAIFLYHYQSLATQYHHRPFDLGGRLLTEGRIVWDYLGQWVLPDTLRMGIYHDDILVSSSLTEPITTLYAVCAWMLTILLCVLLLKWPWGQFLVFGLAWFIVGQAVESTVLPLELYFEHRNYFPAVGLVLALGVLVGGIIKRWPETKSPLLVWLCLPPLLLAAHTSSQVQIWSSRPLLILNHLNGHPNSARANIDMAAQLARLGDIAAALRYSARAFEFSTIERAGDWEIRDLALSCAAGAPVSQQSIDALGRVNPARPFSSVSTLLTLVRLIQDDKCPGIDTVAFADRLADIFLVDDTRQKAAPNIYANLAVLENALQRWDNAYAYSERFLALSPGSTRGLLMKLHFATALGKVEEAGAVVAALQALNQRGGLTVGEQQTLALYMEK